jgi:hypothetical protein
MSSHITQLDANLIDGIVFRVKKSQQEWGRLPQSGSFNLPFQFPPKIINDSRKGEWIEAPLRGEEMVAIFGTSGAREITLQTTYIAGSRGGSSGKLFYPQRIATIMRTLRSYFSRPYGGDGQLDKSLVVDFQMYYQTGFAPFSGRIKSIDITHGKTLVNEYGAFKSMASMEELSFYDTYLGSVHEDPTLLGYGETNTDQGYSRGERTYPLRTDVTIDMRLWSKAADAVGLNASEDSYIPPEDGISLDDRALAAVKIELEGLGNRVPPDWQ